MFGSIGLPELVLIFIVALLLFGPRKLPEIGKTVGKALGEFRRASNDLKRTLEDEVAAADLRETHHEVSSAFRMPVSEAGGPTPVEPDAQITTPTSVPTGPEEPHEPAPTAAPEALPEPPAAEPR
ncbi:MAG TPA: Sec-independent protein translocase protein TatB [Thermoanaerobaculaceae bacterium]|nr:Sec-independent protein translocase protein TatB [Thermoanaerobaculaceae bacterium]HPS78881.1 Sec-independent protein translocase protein TatB [Thermoanaerobaculaceae bacterium]